MKTWDVIIIGGGLIGVSLAIALRKRGAKVLVVERGEPGREASHAAGGMLVDCPLETAPPLQPLATASARMYPEFVHELELESGMKVDLRDHGAILIVSSGSASNPHGENTTRRSLELNEIHELEPELAVNQPEAFHLQERCVDPRALMAAALKTAKHRDVDFSSGDAVTAINLANGQLGVTTTKTSFIAPKIVNCAGAWSGQIAIDQSAIGEAIVGSITAEAIARGKIGPLSVPTRPVKGQMLYLLMPKREFIKHVIRAPEAYLIPRSDGRLLVGTTVEEAGFDKRTDPAAIQKLYRAAVNLVPNLQHAKILEDWAGLRPGTPDALPILGATAVPGYFVATGHYRDGILLAPVTAQIMADVIEGRSTQYDLTPFSPSRF